MNEPISDLASIGVWVERLGGWAVLVVFLYVGWRQFMLLATQFSSGVLTELRGINEKLTSMGSTMEAHESRLDSIDRRLDDLQAIHHDDNHKAKR